MEEEKEEEGDVEEEEEEEEMKSTDPTLASLWPLRRDFYPRRWLGVSDTK